MAKILPPIPKKSTNSTVLGLERMVQKNTAADAMQICIADCLQCAQVCMNTFEHYTQPGKNPPTVIRLLQDCAELCQTNANFMQRESDMSVRTCGLCAEMCDRCANECGLWIEEAALQTCAEICRRCAESCRPWAMTVAAV